MPEQFDPYHKWLGIRPEEQPANHYRLLGITLFEDDPDAITSAAYQRMAHVRTYQLGKHSDLSQKILNELATAKVCLLNPEKKAAYDEQLREITKASLSEAPPAKPEAALDPTAFPTATPLAPAEVPVADPLADLAELTRSAPTGKSQEPKQQSLHRSVALPQATVPAISRTKRRKKGQLTPRGLVFRFIGLAVAGVLGLGTASLLNSYFNKSDRSKKEVAQAEHNQSTRKSEEVKLLVDKRAQSAAVRSPGPTKPSGQTGLPMLERSSDPSSLTVSTKPVIEAKPLVDTAATAEKPPIEETLSQEEEELKAAFEAAKSTEDQQAVAEKGLVLADRAIVEGNTDLAKTAVRKSLAAARKADDVTLTKRATQLLMQLQNPLSESLKEEARKRRGVETPVAQAAEGVPPKADGMTAGILPPLAVAPFNETTAKEHQAAWAKHLGVPVIQTNSIGMEFVLIPPGEFTMGSPKEEIKKEVKAHADERWFVDELLSEEPHRVRITKPFYMGRYVVTQAQWEALMGSNPSWFKGPQNPVEYVSWDDCQVFLEKLNVRFANKKYKVALPTEGQWEYACRAGSTGRYFFGDGEAELGDYAWYKDNSEGRSHPGGQKKANAWGLYDMHGNVWEWCKDWHDENYYKVSPHDDPAGPLSGSERVYRGGCWFHNAWLCRSAFRNHHKTGDRYNDMGFRVSLISAEKQP